MITKDSEILVEYKNQYLREKISEIEEEINDTKFEREEYLYEIGCIQAKIEIDVTKGYDVRDLNKELNKKINAFNELDEKWKKRFSELEKERSIYRSLIK